MLILQKKTVFFVICLVVFSVNVLASSNTFARFERHEPNTPQTKWPTAVTPTPPPGTTTKPNPVAYFRDDGVGAVHYIYGATAGETWTAEVLQPKADGTPGGPIMPAFPVITYSGGCFRIPGSMGAAFVILVPQLLSAYKELVPVVYGVTILIILIFEPLGLYGRWFKMRLYFRNWPFR